MQRNWMQWLPAVILLLALGLTVFFSVRALRQVEPAPTVDVPRVQTEAVAAFASGLTSTAQALPTATFTATSAAETQTPTEAAVATDSTSSVSATPSCYRSKFVKDVTIPDYSVMMPAEVFTKTWQVENSGTCPWQAGFKLILVGGDAMGGSPFVLTSTVNTGARVDISVKMVAPTSQTGLVQGTWQLTDATGTPFGSIFTAVIVVGNTTGGTPTIAAAATP